MEIISFNNSVSAIAKNAVLGFVFQFLLKFKGVIILPVIVHFLPKEVLGEWRIITSSVAVMLPFLTLNLLDGSGMFFSSDVNKDSVRIKFYTLFNLMFILIGCILVIGFVTEFISNISYLSLIILFLCVSIVQKMAIMLLQAYQKSSALLICNFIMEYGSMLLSLLFIYLGYRNITVLFVPIISLYVLISLYLFHTLSKEIKYLFVIDFDFLKKVIPISLPLIPVFIAEWLLSSIGVFFLEYYYNLEIVGEYSILLSLASLILTLRATLQFFWFSTCSNMIPNQNPKFNSIYAAVLKSYLTFGVLILLGYCFFSQLMIDLFANKSYYTVEKPMFLTAIGYLFMCLSTIWNGVLYARKESKKILYSYVIGAIITLFTSPILIKLYGINGASVSYFAGILVLSLLMIYFSGDGFNSFTKKDATISLILVFTIFCLIIYKYFVYETLSCFINYSIGIIGFLVITIFVLCSKYINVHSLKQLIRKK